ncbi:MAG: metal ABC transporter permease [Candidatus Omnitrophica bacterium]|nr:metal ABC transporter permease [Candidatus Omnitrophota bacterium]
MWKPFLACLILTGIHVYLGIHVIERKVIFVDLALAQIAALGATTSILLGHDLHSGVTYWLSLGATVLGAVIFSMTRTRREKIPQEAIIGIVYAMAAASAVMILSRSAEGDEHIRSMLVGNVLLVSLPQIIKILVLYSLLGLFHWYFRRKFLLISTKPNLAFQRGMNVKFWDLIFYLTFGVVVTSSVQIAGVLLVFSFLIVPAVCAILFSSKLSTRLWLGWLIGIGVSFLGIFASYFFDFPTGATIICAFGLVLIILAIIKNIKVRI